VSFPYHRSQVLFAPLLALFISAFYFYFILLVGSLGIFYLFCSPPLVFIPASQPYTPTLVEPPLVHNGTLGVGVAGLDLGALVQSLVALLLSRFWSFRVTYNSVIPL
jgi:hypothetical protein